MGTNAYQARSFRQARLLMMLFVAAAFSACSREPKQTYVSPPPTVAPTQVNPWKEAAAKLEEDRGEPTGKKAQVQIPDEMRHYSDRRRFLAIQVAESREQDYSTPADFTQLISQIKSGQLVEMEPLGPDYILYGVGANADDEPFSYYDAASRKDIPLYASPDEFQREYDRLTEQIQKIQPEVSSLEKELKQLKKRDRERRKELSNKLAGSRTRQKEITDRRALLGSFYKNPERSKKLFSDYQTIAQLASDFNGTSYDLRSPESRQQLKVRLLSFIRPEARALILELARLYEAKFDRPLPITSLVRTERYQKHLGEKNPNATQIGVPPHTTGLAFDIYYRYMTADEQAYLMGELARIENEGRLEAIRENRDHFHVFAFADGRRPDEQLIAEAMGKLRPAAGDKPGAGSGKPGKAQPRSAAVARSNRGGKGQASRVATSKTKKGKPVARAEGRSRPRGNN